MATESAFQLKFIKPLIECYGQTKLPNIRIQKIWEKVKAYPDHLLGQCVDRIILNYDLFPGVQGILNVCAEVCAEFSRLESDRIKESVNCHRCRSQGVLVVNNYAYKCTCQLGELLYPAFPLFQGQVQFQERVYTDKEGNRIYENNDYRAVTPKGCRDIRQVKTVIKSPLRLVKEESRPEFMAVDFSGLLPEEHT